MIPRDEIKIRKKLLDDCRRPAFAHLARYTKEVDETTGETVTRASVKFVEMALQRWGNVRVGNVLILDRSDLRRVNVMIQDLETGAEFAREIDIEKNVDRARPAKHERILGTRVSAIGTVYIVPATEDDLAAKEAVMTSVVVRQLGLRILPADLVAECMDQVAKTLAGLDPDQEVAEPSRPDQRSSQENPESSRSSALAGLLKKRKADAKTSRKKANTAVGNKKRRHRK